MRIVIAQPIHETQVQQLENTVSENPTADLFLFPEGYLQNEMSLVKAQSISKKNQVILVTSYRKERVDIPVIIDRNGNICYTRRKTASAATTPLEQPLESKLEGKNIAYLLCMEILKGERDLLAAKPLDLIFHPIGVGMYNEEQLEKWLAAAKKIAMKTQAIIIGTSHADGSYKNCGTSIPVAYAFDKQGKEIFLLKNKTQTQVIDLEIFGS